jgi:hypothetical protein
MAEIAMNKAPGFDNDALTKGGLGEIHVQSNIVINAVISALNKQVRQKPCWGNHYWAKE